MADEVPQSLDDELEWALLYRKKKDRLTYHHIGLVIIVDSLLREIPTQRLHRIDESGFKILILLEPPDRLGHEFKIDTLIVLGFQEKIGLQQRLLCRFKPVEQEK